MYKSACKIYNLQYCMYNVYKNFKAPLSNSDATTGGFFGSGKGPVLFSNLLCNGTEDSLNSCAVDDINNVDCEDAGVVCNGKYILCLSIYLPIYRFDRIIFHSSPYALLRIFGPKEGHNIVPFFGSSGPKKAIVWSLCPSSDLRTQRRP